jgi:hypothetical protein
MTSSSLVAASPNEVLQEPTKGRDHLDFAPLQVKPGVDGPFRLALGLAGFGRLGVGLEGGRGPVH